MDGHKLTGKIKKEIINLATELVGDIPFDWWLFNERHTFVAFFGLETWELALAAQARLQDSNFHSRVFNEDLEDRVLGKFLRQAEAEGREVEVYDGNGERVDWKSDPRWAERKSN
jgi:hypothetical protein